jgi:hypothetical protein
MRDLFDHLLAEITKRLSAEGYRKSQQTFARVFPGGRWLFHIAWVPHTVDFDVIADVAVRHDALQEASLLYEHLDERQKRKTATLGIELGNLQGTGQHRWTVRSVRDVVPVSDSILAMYCAVGVPFLQRFTAMDEVKRVFLDDEDFARRICHGTGYREEIVSMFKSGRI